MDGEGVARTVYGKWRRAPLLERQTNTWECFDSILWDPAHADFVVPQELDTEQVMKDLKYIEMLRPQLAAKEYTVGRTKHSDRDGKGPAKGVRNVGGLYLPKSVFTHSNMHASQIEQTGCAVMIGSISVAVRNCEAEQANNQPEAHESFNIKHDKKVLICHCLAH